MYTTLSIISIVISVVLIFVASLYFSMTTLEKNYYECKRDCYYFLNKILYKKLSYFEIKSHRYFNIIFQNEFIEEKYNTFIITSKGISYLNNNNFVEKTRFQIVTAFTIFVSISNIVLQVLIILK